jgi:hypothetical protein
VTRAVLILAGAAERARALNWIAKAPVNTRVEFKAPKRTLDQSAAMWAALTDIARQLDWHGQRLSTEDWKCLFMAALNTEMRLVPNLDGTGFVPLGRSSSDLSREEMSQLLDLIHAFAAQRGIALKEAA